MVLLRRAATVASIQSSFNETCATTCRRVLWSPGAALASKYLFLISRSLDGRGQERVNMAAYVIGDIEVTEPAAFQEYPVIGAHVQGLGGFPHGKYRIAETRPIV